MKIKILDVGGFILGIGIASPYLNGYGSGLWLAGGIAVFLLFVIGGRFIKD